MSKRKNQTSFSKAKYVSIFLFVFSIIGFLGGKFKIIIGKQIYNMLAAILGSMAWGGLLVCLLLAFFIWKWSDSLFFPGVSGGPRSSKSKSNQAEQNHTEIAAANENEKINSGIPLPVGKLVNLQGFNKYFASPEWVEIKDNEISEEMKELGNNFPSYFGRGESVHPHQPQKLTVLNGLAAYIEEVDQEEKPVYEAPPSLEIPSPGIYDLGTLNTEQFSSVFKTQKEQEDFLAQFKVPDTLFEKESHDDKVNDVDKADNETTNYIENLQKMNRPIDKTINIRQILESADSTPVDSPDALPEAVKFKLEDEEVSSFMDDEAELLEFMDAEESLQSNEPSEKDLKPKEREGLPETLASNLDLEPKTGQDTQSVDVSAEEDVSKPKISPQLPINNWQLPDLNLLDPVPEILITDNPETSKLLEQVLLDFGVKAKVVYVTRGPVITRYELVPAPGVKISKIVNLADDIALGLAARDVRIEAPIPGKAAIGIEVPNKKARSVPFREVLETDGFGQYPSKLRVALGKDIANQPIIADLIKMPHLLVAGARGSGKSVCITTIINSILFNANPDEVKFLLVDPKMVELSLYNGIPHLLAPVVVDPKKAAGALKWIVKEMENRYELFAAAGVRDIDRYNRLKAEESEDDQPALPLIVVIIDELADLMLVAAGDVEEAICRLAQMARAAGIHLVIATQRPSVDVITGVIKANIPSRISFAVSSQIDSRTILDATGAEKLLGRGDMLYSPLGTSKPLRVQGCLVTDDEVHRVISHWKEMGKPDYLDPERLFSEITRNNNEESNGSDDALFLEAGRLFIRTGMASVSYLQRRLKLGYTRAARLMDMLEEQGVVGSYEGSKPRQVLLTIEEFEERFG